MSDFEHSFVTPTLPYDSDGQLIEVIWKRLRAASRRLKLKGARLQARNGQSAEKRTVQLSSAELQALLAALHDRMRSTQRLIIRVESALNAVDC